MCTKGAFLTTSAIWKWLREVPGEDQAHRGRIAQVSLGAGRGEQYGPFGQPCVRPAQSTHPTLFSAQLMAVNHRINSQCCWLLPVHFSTGSKGCEMFMFLFHSQQISIITSHNTECLLLGSTERNGREYTALPR